MVPLTSEQLEQDSAWWRIYRESFPGEEREPREVIMRGVELGVALASRLSREGRTVGIASAHLLKGVDVVFLVYLAIDRRERRRGLGGDLFEFAWTSALEHEMRRGRRLRGMIWEIDPPETAPGGMEAVRRKERVDFFERMGGVMLPQPYLQPPVAGVAVPMRLMVRCAPGVPTPDGAEVQRIIEAMYLEKYAALNGIPVEKKSRGAGPGVSQ